MLAYLTVIFDRSKTNKIDTHDRLLNGGAELRHADVLVLAVGGNGHQENVTGSSLGSGSPRKTRTSVATLKIITQTY